MLLLLALVPSGIQPFRAQCFVSAVAQINLGQFGFHPTGNGGWDLGLGQSANIMGFGGDRGLKLGQGPQGFGLQCEFYYSLNYDLLNFERHSC